MEELLEWLKARARGESDAAKTWDGIDTTAHSMHIYASNQYWEVIDYMERNYEKIRIKANQRRVQGS